MITEEDFTHAIKSDPRLKNCFIRTYPWSTPTSGPLNGLTCAIKDNIAVKDFPVTFGMKPAAVATAPNDAAIVTALRASGLTIVGSTNLDEACLNYLGDNRHYGRMVNPFDPERIVSGSSGGSALAVACDVADIGVGTDMGGSIRGPAACCGLYGLKCSSERFSLSGILSLAPSFESIGFLAKQPAMLKRLFLGLGQLGVDTKISEILVPIASEMPELSISVQTALRSVSQKFSQRITVRSLTEPLGFLKARQLRKILIAGEMAKQMALLKIDSSTLPKEGLAVLELAKKLSARDVEIATLERQSLTTRIREIVGDHRAILYPSFAAEVPLWSDIQKGKLIRAGQLGTFLALTNLVGLPTLAFPVGGISSSFPPSLQLMAPKNSEVALLEAVSALSV